MVTADTKLYVQLRPEAVGLQTIQRLQAELDADPGILFVKPEALHLTVIHIGQVDRLQRSLIATGHTANLPFDRLVDQQLAVVQPFETSLFTLPIDTVERFGRTAATPALTFKPSDELRRLHGACLLVLQDFLKGTADFMAQDSNLHYALELRPHLTLAKNYRGQLPAAPSGTMQFSLMPLVY